MDLLRVENLEFSYNKSNEKTLKNMNFSIQEGSYNLVVGKSGSGKSTLFRLLNPLVTPLGEVCGEIFLKNESISAFNDKELVKIFGMVFQDISSQIVTDNVLSELVFPLENLGYSDEKISCKVAEISQYFGLNKLLNSKISTLSGGQKRIVSLASALMTTPKILLLDEPTVSLDPLAKKNFYSLIKRINSELGITIIIIEHCLDYVFDSADNFIFIDKGTVSFQGDKDEFLKYFNENNISDITLPTLQSLPIKLRINDVSFKNISLAKKHFKENNSENLNKYKFEMPNFEAREKALQIKNVYFRYDKKEKDILSDFNLTVFKGEMLGILGGNGCGKTTLINIISKIKKPYNGKVKIFKNNDNTELKTSVLPQNVKNLFSFNTVKEELYSFCKLIGSDILSLEKLISKFNIEDILHCHPYDLSGGEVQKVGLIKMLIVDCDIVILDEPTQNVDAIDKEVLIDIIKDIKNQGKTVVLVTHDLEFASNLTDRCMMIYNGKSTVVQKSRDFFKNNDYYTTTSSLIFRDFQSGIMNENEAIKVLGNG